MNSMEYIKFENFIKSVQYGYTADATYSKGSNQYLRITDIVPYFVDKARVPYVLVDEKISDKYLVKKDDLLIARTGATTGYNLLVPEGFENFIFASYLVRYFYDKEKLYPLYLKHVLKSQQWYGFIKNFIGGSAQPGMNPRTMGKFAFPYHDFLVQQKIASILNQYDLLIENNNKRIKLLEQTAQEIFKEWFVRGRNPYNLKCELKKLSELCNIKSGYAFKSTDWTENGKIVVKIKDIVDGFVEVENCDCVSEQTAKKAENYILNKRDLVIAMTGATIGKIGLVCENDLYANQRVGKFFLNDEFLDSMPYLYCFFRMEYVTEIVLLYSGSSAAQPNISGEALARIDIPYNTMLIHEFNRLTNSFFEKIIILKEKNKILIKQRDLLLPRLMAGKLEVK